MTKRKGTSVIENKKPLVLAPLYEQINTILYKADVAKFRFYQPTAGNPFVGAVIVLNEVMAANENKAEPLLPEMPDCWELKNEQVLLLLALHESQDSQHREAFVSALRNCFPRKAAASKWSAYFFVVLARVSGFPAAVESALYNFFPDGIGWKILLSISEYLKYDNGRLSDEEISGFLPKVTDLSRILTQFAKEAEATSQVSKVNDCINTLRRIDRQIREIKYLRLKGALQREVNLEVNQDRERLKEELGRFGFGKELTECLERIEVLYRQAEDKFDFKSCVDLNRSFFEAFMWQIAQKVARVATGNPQPDARKASPGSVRDYLKKMGYFSERLHKMAEAFYHFASDESAHRLSSGREVARIVRNLNIELGLLLVHRLKTFSANASTVGIAASAVTVP